MVEPKSVVVVRQAMPTFAFGQNRSTNHARHILTSMANDCGNLTGFGANPDAVATPVYDSFSDRWLLLLSIN